MERACGEGLLSKVFENAGYNVKSTDVIERDFGKTVVDFLSIGNLEWNDSTITNPPYKYAQAFIEKALRIKAKGKKIAMFLKIQFLESKVRKTLPKNILTFN